MVNMIQKSIGVSWLWDSVVALVLGASLLAVPLQASAVVLVSNFGETPSPWGNAYMGPTFPNNYGVAQAFHTDGQHSTLDTIRAVVGDTTGSPHAFAELRAATPSGDLILDPAGLLTTFTVPNFDGALSARSFLPSASVSLEPDTTYFFVLYNDGAGSRFEWDYTESLNSSGSGSIPAEKTYFYSDDGGDVWLSGNGSPAFIEVNVTPVPEVGGLASCLAVFGVMVVCAASRSWAARRSEQ